MQELSQPKDDERKVYTRFFLLKYVIPKSLKVTLPETNSFAPENWWLGDDPASFWCYFRPYFQGRFG